MEKKKLQLAQKAKTLPKSPGCYLLKQKDGKILYIGKAKNLRKRVLSYFLSSQKSTKTEVMIGHVFDFEFIITQTEVLALVLENNLIKKHSPKYNISLRDDKTYPYVMIDLNDPFPRLQITRKISSVKGRKFFGPFVQGSGIREVVKVLIKSFCLRDCTLREFKTRKTPCLRFQMKQCLAPCVGRVTEEEYRTNVDYVLNFFSGNIFKKSKVSLKVLKDRMLELAELEDYEHAAIIRDNIFILEEFIQFMNQKSCEVKSTQNNIDIISFYPGDDEIDISINIIRNGIHLGGKSFNFKRIDCLKELEEEILDYLYQYYLNNYSLMPDRIELDVKHREKIDLFQDAINELRTSKGDRKKVKLSCQNKTYATLMKLTYEQALQNNRVRSLEKDDKYLGLNKLKELLELKELPRNLECFDVAIWQGKSPTASKIVFVDGVPVKSKYRHYHLKERPEGNNDYEMMKEILARRIVRGDLPDVLIVDGGKGQVRAFLEILKEFDAFIPVVGLAKAKVIKKDKNYKNDSIERTEERLIVPGRANPYILTKNPALFKILVQMRDEAHRFSRRLHHKAEQKRLLGKN